MKASGTLRFSGLEPKVSNRECSVQSQKVAGERERKKVGSERQSGKGIMKVKNWSLELDCLL